MQWGGQMNPDLSIIIPLCDQAQYIGRMLDSIAAQEGLRPEIIVVDDVSTDGGGGVVERWAEEHRDVLLKLLRQPKRQYALAARLAGIGAATAPDIMMADADDRLLGTRRLARVLARKREYGAELAHFRTQMTEPGGRLISEANFDNPLTLGALQGRPYLEAFTAKSWPPSELWGKIYSLNLLNRVIPLLGDAQRYRLDTILACLAMLATKSYLGCEEFIYEYKTSDTWPLLKFVQRMHDFPLNTASMLATGTISDTVLHYAKKYIDNFWLPFIAWNAGKMSDEFERALTSGKDVDELLSSMEGYIDSKALIAETLFSTTKNASKIHNCVNRILHEF